MLCFFKKENITVRWTWEEGTSHQRWKRNKDRSRWREHRDHDEVKLLRIYSRVTAGCKYCEIKGTPLLRHIVEAQVTRTVMGALGIISVFLKFSTAALRNAQDYLYNRRDCMHVCFRITWSYTWLNHFLIFNPITLQSCRLKLPLLDVCLKLHTAGKYSILETRLKTWQTKTFDILPVFLRKCNNCPFYLSFSLQERKERRGER